MCVCMVGDMHTTINSFMLKETTAKRALIQCHTSPQYTKLIAGDIPQLAQAMIKC